MAQAGVFLLLAWAGLRQGYRVGLDAPYLRRWLHAGATPVKSAAWTLAIALGLAVGGACIATDFALHGFAVQSAASHDILVPAAWKGLLASFYGGITEEIACRLFLVSVFVWIGARLQRSAPPGAATYGVVIMVAAVLFGVAHLPALAQTGSLTLAGITRTRCSERAVRHRLRLAVLATWTRTRDGRAFQRRHRAACRRADARLADAGRVPANVAMTAPVIMPP
ncbi:MAG TPA: CPBP family glutamic-type intramembrane protease [Rudaea sp.]